ncbi:MAG: PDZ domain-containing protein [Planctomycetaceae bacterium]|jgi:carboxyl-terminal processing protease|nr:PDZ domain-containing protein [Planctomycetaceae bacterium]
MPRFHYYIILFSLLFYFFCSGVTIRDRILVDTFHRIERQALSPPESRQLFEGAMSGMFKTLDKYSYYTPAAGKKDYNNLLDNHYEGIGLVSTPAKDKKSVEVIYPIVDSPAFRAGLRSGDRIVAVNGVDVTESQVTNFSSLIRELNNTDIAMTVLQFGKTDPIDIKVRPAPLDMDSVEGDGIDANGNRNFLLESDNEIGYIRITTFSRHTADEFNDALRQLYQQQARGLIIDLRGNPGGYVEVSIKIAIMLLDATDSSTIIVSTKNRDGLTKNHYGKEKSQICSLPIVVLIDGGTASASEILAAALQDYKRAIIVGTRSFGKGVVQGIYDLPANSGTYQLTGVSYWRPSNRNINRTENADESDEWGVIPDIEHKLELSKLRSHAIDSIRNRRANAVGENRDAYLNSYIAAIEKDVEEIRSELNKSSKNNKTNKAENLTPENKTDEKPDKNIKVDNNKNSTDEIENKVENKVEVETEIDADEIDDSQDINVPFKLQGEPPYFDPQLDDAVKILKELISGISVSEILDELEAADKKE